MALIPSLSLPISLSRTAAAMLVSVSLLLACSSSETSDGSQGGSSAITPTTKALPGAACTTHGDCSNGSCYVVPDPPACSVALPSGSPRPGTCCIPAGSAPTKGDARSCCNGDIRGDGLCCKGAGQWPAAPRECCTGKVDGNGYCTDPAPHGRPAGSPCVLNADCASGKCPNPCVDILSGGAFCE